MAKKFFIHKLSVLGFVALFFFAGLTLSQCGKRPYMKSNDKVVYHISEVEKVPFVLNNINNHIKGAKNPKLDIIVVVHGPGLKPFHNDKTTKGIASKVKALQENKVKFNACGNTMDVQKVGLKEILDGFTRRNEGGVVRIAELQSKGYIYLRP